MISSDDRTFQELLKMLSDTSDEVVKLDLQLLAQMSTISSHDNFKKIISSLLDIFASDRSLLEGRGSLIIRELCARLNPEKIYLAFAENLETTDDWEFASTMVLNLNTILGTEILFQFVLV